VETKIWSRSWFSLSRSPCLTRTILASKLSYRKVKTRFTTNVVYSLLRRWVSVF
jgi:hypothetical protein